MELQLKLLLVWCRMWLLSVVYIGFGTKTCSSQPNFVLYITIRFHVHVDCKNININLYHIARKCRQGKYLAVAESGKYIHLYFKQLKFVCKKIVSYENL